MREWVAKFQYPGKRLCYFGTVRAETEMQAEQLARKRWKETLPFDPPSVFTLIPGSITLQLEDTE